MTLLKPAVKDNALLKMAVRGQSGSGKTWLATAVAIGLHKHIKSKKPIAFWDTENALSYVLPHFEANDIDVLEIKSRAFKDARGFFEEAAKHSDIAIIDSITHIWQELIESFLRKKNKRKMSVWDWGQVKPQYKNDVLENIINSPLHLIVCGRLQDIFGFVEVDGDKVLTTTGTKMSAEKSTEYEPSLTVEMERYTLSEEQLRERARDAKAGIQSTKALNKISRYRMLIIKDRANVLSGAYEFEPMPGGTIPPDNEMWRAVKPFCDTLSIGGDHKGVDTARNSEEIFGDRDRDVQEYKRQIAVCLEEIEAELKSNFGSGQKDKAKMVALLKEVFRTASWTKIKNLSLEELRLGRDKVQTKLKNPAQQQDQSGDNAGANCHPSGAGAPDVLEQLDAILAKSDIDYQDYGQAMNIADPDSGFVFDDEMEKYVSTGDHYAAVRWIKRKVAGE